MKKKIAIIDYGIGNILSVQRALETLGANVILTKKEKEITDVSHVILPGVGAFGAAMNNLNKFNLLNPILETTKKGNFLLGICLGMQMLLSKSFEFGNHQGLDLIKGKVVKIEPKKENKFFKSPYIGWSNLQLIEKNKSSKKNILSNLKDDEKYYFIHSYEAIPDDPASVISKTFEQGRYVNAVISKENIFGCQFHPEKSREQGLRILKNFFDLN